jgi:hypothetical protein
MIRALSIPVSALSLGTILSLSLQHGYTAIMVLAVIAFVGLVMRSLS